MEFILEREVLNKDNKPVTITAFLNGTRTQAISRAKKVECIPSTISVIVLQIIYDSTSEKEG